LVLVSFAGTQRIGKLAVGQVRIPANRTAAVTRSGVPRWRQAASQRS